MKFRRILEVHFPASFTEKVLGAIQRFMCSKMKQFAIKLRRILEVFALQALQKRSVYILTIYASKNETVCHEVQKHFESSLAASFTQKF